MTNFDLTINLYRQTYSIYQYLKKRQENKKFYKYLEINTTLIIFIFFLFFAIKPAISTIFLLNGQIKAKEKINQQMQQKITNIMSSQENFIKLQEKNNLLEASLPNYPSFSQAANQIQKSAEDAGIGLDEINFNLKTDSATGSDTSKFYSHSIKVGCDYQKCLHFLDNILNNRRLFEVSNIKLSSSQNNSVNDTNTISSQINLSFNINSYYWSK